MERFAIVETPKGAFGFVARGSRLVATYLPQSRRAIVARIREAFGDVVEDQSLLPRVQRDVADYFGGRRVRFGALLDLSDQPPYRRAVLEACRKIPFGKTASYADLARATDNPRAARAVGTAMANNPLPLVVPCHRVLCSDGSLGGFSSPLGIKQKLEMLQIEGVNTDRFRVVGSGRARVVRVA